MTDRGSSLAAAPSTAQEAQEWWEADVLRTVRLARERLRLSRDENGEWPAELRAFVASELSYPRVATDAHERKAIAMLDALDVYAKATT